MSLNLTQLIKPLPELYDGLKQDLLSRKTKPDLPISLLALNSILWGLHKKELLVIASRPSNGKTSLALQLAWEMANIHKTTYFVSLEMSKESLLERLLCQSQGIDHNLLRRGRLSEDIKAKMEVFRRGATDVPLLLLDGIGFRFKELEQMVRELEPKPEILVLDYIQLISTEYRISKVEMLTEYVRQFKELAVKNNFVGILLSQINRGVENRAEKEPLLSELKGSGSLEECADTVLMLYWPWKNDTANDFNTFKIIVGKQRHGETGSIEVDFYPNLYFFKDKK